MKTLAALALLALTQPAEACHRFARWNYPWPQRCAGSHAPAPVIDRSWYVEIVLPDERAAGIEALKRELAK